MKRIISLIFAGAALLTSLPMFANIAEGNSGSCTWVIDNDGNLTVSSEMGYGEAELDAWVGKSAPWSDYRESITTVVFDSPVIAKTCSNMFNGCTNLKAVYLDNLYTDNVTDMSNMFANCTSLEIIEFTSSWAGGCSFGDKGDSFASEAKGNWSPRSNFLTTNVKNMSGMFSGCKSIQYFSMLDLDVKNVTDFSLMFADCVSIERVDLTSLAVQKNSDVNMNDMFKNCSSLMNIINQHVLPSKIDDGTFLSLPTRGLCSVDVPLDCLEDYESAIGWRYLFFADGEYNLGTAYESTAINEITNSVEENAPLFSLAGNRLTAAAKGVNIVGGKKVVVK